MRGFSWEWASFFILSWDSLSFSFAFPSLKNSFWGLLSLSVSSKFRLALGLDRSPCPNAQLSLDHLWIHPSSFISLSSLRVLISALQENWFWIFFFFCTILQPRVLCPYVKLLVGAGGYPGETESGSENLAMPPLRGAERGGSDTALPSWE